MTQTTRQLYPPAESPYEPSVGGQRPNQIYPSDAEFPLNVGEPGFLLGTMHIEVPGVRGLFLETDVLYRQPLKDADAQMGITTGDLDEVTGIMPDFFWDPTGYYPVRTSLVENRQLTVHYRDYAQKHPRLKRPYRVTVVVEYVETHPAIEALPDASLRDRIYRDLLLSDYSVVPIDVAKYVADPNYSVVTELRRKYARFYDAYSTAYHPTLEALQIT